MLTGVLKLWLTGWLHPHTLGFNERGHSIHLVQGNAPTVGCVQ
jgi:hypothetical protein